VFEEFLPALKEARSQHCSRRDDTGHGYSCDVNNDNVVVSNITAGGWVSAKHAFSLSVAGKQWETSIAVTDLMNISIYYM